LATFFAFSLPLLLARDILKLSQEIDIQPPTPLFLFPPFEDLPGILIVVKKREKRWLEWI